MNNMVSVPENTGATVMTVNETVYDTSAITTLNVQTSEYWQEMDSYVQMANEGID